MVIHFLMLVSSIAVVLARKPASPCKPNGDDCPFRQNFGILDSSKWDFHEFHIDNPYKRLVQYSGRNVKESKKKGKTSISMVFDPTVQNEKFVPFSSGQIDTTNKFSLGCFKTTIRHSLVYG